MSLPFPPVTLRKVPRYWFWLAGAWAAYLLACYFLSVPCDPLPALRAILNVERFPNPGFFTSVLLWGHLLEIILVGISALAATWALGNKFNRWAGLRPSGPLTGFVLDFGLGILVLNTFWMGTGFLHLWHPAVWGSAGILALVWTLRGLHARRDAFRGWSSAFGPAWKRTEWITALFALLGLFHAVVVLAHSLLPETFYDSLNYFLGMPAYWLLKGGICDYPTHLLSGYFHGGSLYFLNAYLYAGTEGAKFLAAGVWILCALFAGGWAGEAAGPRAGFLAWGFLATFPLLYLNAWAVRVDALTALVLLLFVYAFDRFLREENPAGVRAWALAWGLLAGLALSIKPTAVTVLGAVFLAVLFSPRRRIPWERKNAFLTGAACAAFVVLPWFLKNAAFTGNPFFPYALHWFPQGRQFPQEGYLRLLHENQQFFSVEGWKSWIAFPWNLLMPEKNGEVQFVGPLFLGFLPLVLMTRFSNETWRFLARTCLFSFVLGLAMSHMLRFLMPSFALFFTLAAAALAARNLPAWKTWPALACLSAVLAFPFYYLNLSAGIFDGTGVWAGRETGAQYLKRQLSNSYEDLAEWTDGNLPKDARLLVEGDARGVYYRRPTYANSVFDGQFLAQAARSEVDAAGILRRLRRLGVTHLVVNTPEGARNALEYHLYDLTKPEWNRLSDFVRLGLEPLYFKNFQAVYAVGEQLSKEPRSYLLDPFSFFSVPAVRLQNAVQVGDVARAEGQVDKVLEFFPQESYWWEQKGFLNERGRQEAKALQAYERGDQLGRLTLEGYRHWADLALKLKDAKQAARAARRAAELYPKEDRNRLPAGTHG